MASGPFVFPDLAKLNFLDSATGLLKSASANYRMALLTSAWTPAPSTDEVWANMSANEILAGFGYSAGGGALSGVTLTQSAGAVKFTANPQIWTASGGSIPAWRYGLVYYLGTLNGKVDPVVGYFLGDSTPADIPATTTGNTLTVTPNASGILQAS